MAGVLLLSCFLLAVAGVTSLQSASHPVRRGAQQLTEEPPRENRTALSQKGKSDDGMGAVIAYQLTQLSSLKDKQHALEISQLTTQSELQSTKSELQSTKSDLQSTKSELRSTKSNLQSTKSELQSELNSTKSDLLSTKSELQFTKSELQSTKSELQSELKSTKSELNSTKSELKSTKSELQSTKSDLQYTKSKLQSTKTDLQLTKSELKSTKSDLQTAKKELQISQAKIETKVEKLNMSKGSSFVRWGRKTCPKNTTLVYYGLAAGKKYNIKGSGTNTLCLTRTPQFDNEPKPQAYGTLFSAEYQDIGGFHRKNVPCSVCLAPQSTTIMVPATLTCPPGWTPQYTGHLASERDVHYGGEYVCLDRNPEESSGGRQKDHHRMFCHVVTLCDNLPCPPYTNGKVVTCVVCSK